VIELALRVVFSLAVIIGLLILVAKYAGRRFKGHPGAAIQVVHRQQLTRNSAVTLVTVGGRALLLGVTDSQINLLTEVDPLELEIAEPDFDLDADEEFDLDLEPAEESPVGIHPASGPLAGSVLSPDTWRQAFTAISRIGKP